jgi:hypothetical protein
MKELTAGQITKAALMILESRQCFVWRSNNLPVPGRKFTGLKGVPDICGFHKRTGVAVYCEVKTVNDRFSEHQINFMDRAKMAGCHCLIATEIDGKIVLTDWLND